ncbi:MULTISPECIES: amidohydrolase family protein [unclassified Parafrankia]|uniref:amidohydrolase family protein n=1 Tax=unclassified Parafrankia TaxID=2994368 RepID=UPI000DD4CA17|nr:MULTISPECIES: amidohydrolase family protein [unclassified Parafrankia]TCJ33423.1 amidohydrolase [Parafrankia sp. BMG5.11]
MPRPDVHDAHRHLGVLPAHPYYGGPPVVPDVRARATIAQLRADLDAERTSAAVVIPNYGVPKPSVAFGFNELCVEAAQVDERILAGLWVSARPEDTEATERALALAGERGVVALKLSFLLGGDVTDPACRSRLDRIFAVARAYDLVVHVHTSPGGAADVDRMGTLVDDYAAEVAVHLVHLGGGPSGHIKLIGGRFFDWVAAGRRVYTDASWAVGFAPRWFAAEVARRGLGHDRLLFASDEPWSDHEGELARLTGAIGDPELARRVLAENFRDLYLRERTPRPHPATTW